MIVADLMTSKPVTVRPSDTLEQAQQWMETGRFRQLPVVEEGKLIGIITDRDLRQHAGQSKHIRVDAVMSAHPFSAHPSTPIEVAAHMLATNKVGSLPVIENAKLVGIITATDLLCALEAILGSAGKCTVRIDLDVAGSGEITAALSLIRTICPVLTFGTYTQKATEREILFLRVATASAQQASDALRKYGFKVVAVHMEGDPGADKGVRSQRKQARL
jgi:acetoin utilization protein AcuB